MRCIAVRQPWAWLLFHGKPVENRDWYTAYRGTLAILASKGMTHAEYEDAVAFVRSFDAELAGRIPHPESLVYGAVLGTVEQVGCVRSHASPFFCGAWGHVYEQAKLLPAPVPAKGQLGIFEWTPPALGLAVDKTAWPSLFGGTSE